MATPHMRPLQQQTWETFSVNWQTDVRIAFHWLREALLRPLQPGSRVIVFSSGAALNPNGSPLSGGYAGAKATQRFVTAYAQEEARRAGLGITFTTVLHMVPEARRSLCLREAARVLPPGGRLLLVDYAGPVSERGHMSAKHGLHGQFDLHRLREPLAAAGFERIEGGPLNWLGLHYLRAVRS